MSSRFVGKVGVLLRSTFTVYDSADAPVTGLLNGGFTKLLSKNGVDDATVVTVTEIANGRYEASFTPASAGTWYLLVSHATRNPRGWDEEFVVTADGILPGAAVADHVLKRSLASAEASSDGDALAFRSLAGAVSKHVNKVTVAAGTLTVKKTDDATTLGTQAVTSSAGADPITEVDTN